MIALGFDILEWLLRHPLGLIATCLVGVAGLTVWWMKPITWRDGEGDVVAEGEKTASWIRFVTDLFGG